MKLTDLLKEAIGEISYKKAGLQHPNKADLNHDKNISSYEKKRGSAIEKAMSKKPIKKEYRAEDDENNIRFGMEVRPLQTMPSLDNGEVQAMGNQCEQCGAPMMYEDKMCSECGYMQEGQIEEEHHEVFMAQSNLESIIKNATELLHKLGTEEQEVPAWVADHITKSQTYVEQANDGFYFEGDDEEQMHQEPDGDEYPAEELYEAKKKPSAGLSKKQKSTIVKKAQAGKDIGKKGSGFAAVEKSAKASGADNPKAVAAAAMWKGAAKRAHK